MRFGPRPGTRHKCSSNLIGGPVPCQIVRAYPLYSANPARERASTTLCRAFPVKCRIGDGRLGSETSPLIAAAAATTRRLPCCRKRFQTGSRREDRLSASKESPRSEARVIASASLGNKPPMTEYQAVHPAVIPVAATSSPLIPSIIRDGTEARSAATLRRAGSMSGGTPGILIERT